MTATNFKVKKYQKKAISMLIKVPFIVLSQFMAKMNFINVFFVHDADESLKKKGITPEILSATYDTIFENFKCGITRVPSPTSFITRTIILS